MSVESRRTSSSRRRTASSEVGRTGAMSYDDDEDEDDEEDGSEGLVNAEEHEEFPELFAATPERLSSVSGEAGGAAAAAGSSPSIGEWKDSRGPRASDSGSVKELRANSPQSENGTSPSSVDISPARRRKVSGRQPVFVWVSAFGTLFAPAVVVGQTKSGKVAVDLIDTVRNRTVRREVDRSALQDVISNHNIIKNPPSNLIAATKSNDYNYATVLYTIRWRHAHERYFTSCGKLLISVNPCEIVDGQFSDEAKNLAKARVREFTEEPHVYNLLTQSIRELNLKPERPQCIAFSGIPCSGKSHLFAESIEFLRYDLAAGDELVSERLGSALHMLQAFGNAKTILNHDSNRYGVSVRISVNALGNAVTGFEFSTFTFQQTRLLIRLSDQRNFHVFYYFLQFLDDETKRQYFLEDDVITFTYLNRTGCLRATHHDDEGGYENLRQAFNAFEVTEVEEGGIYSIIAAVLNLGNIAFQKLRSGVSAQITPESRKYLKRVAALLQVDEQDLENLLVVERSSRRNRRASIHVATAAISSQTRDRLAMCLYSRLFHWVVDKINMRDRATVENPDGDVRIFQLVDVPGFEKLSRNSLEQLFLNVTDEVMQREFYTRMCNSGSSLLDEEEIEAESVVVHDSDLVLGVLGVCISEEQRRATGSSRGIFQLLDEQTRVGGNDRTFLAKVIQAHSGVIVDYEQVASNGVVGRSRIELVQKTGKSKNMFKIMHFIGPASYNTEQLVQKNVDAETVASLEQFIVNKCKSTMLSFLFDVKAPLNRRSSIDSLNSDGTGGSRAISTSVGNSSAELRNLAGSSRFDGGSWDRRSTRIGRASTNVYGEAGSATTSPGALTANGSNFASPLSGGSRDGRVRTRSQFFADEMQQLAEGLRETNLSFVKCIRANPEYNRTKFAADTVLSQVVNGGVFAAGESYRSQYSVVETFRDFYREYKHLASTKRTDWHRLPPQALKELCSDLIRDICSLRTSDPVVQQSIAAVKLGKSHCLMQEAQLEQLNTLSYSTRMDSIVQMQKVARGLIYSRQYSRVRVLAKAARSALAARDLSRLKGILANVLAERPRLYDNTSGHTSSGTTRSRLASAGSDASLDALAAIAKGQASTRANRNILHSSFQGSFVPEEYDFRCHLFRKLQTMIWSLESELEFHPVVNEIRKHGLNTPTARQDLARAQAIVAKLTRAYEVNPELRHQSSHMEEFIRLVTKWQEFIRIEDILLRLQSHSISRMPLVLAVGALKSLHVLVKQCERSFQQMGVQDQLLSARRQIKHFQQRLHQEYQLVTNILAFVEDSGCVSGGLYQLEVPKAEVYKLEAAAERLRDFQETLRVVDVDVTGTGSPSSPQLDAVKLSENAGRLTPEQRELELKRRMSRRRTRSRADSSKIAEVLAEISNRGPIAPLTLTARRALFLADKLVALRKAVIEFQHVQKEAVSREMCDNMQKILSKMRDTDGFAVTLSPQEEEEVHRSIVRYEHAVFMPNRRQGNDTETEQSAHFCNMRDFDRLWERWISEDSPEVALVRRELNLHIDVDDFVWSLQKETSGILEFRPLGPTIDGNDHVDPTYPTEDASGPASAQTISYFNVDECLDIPCVDALKQSYDALVRKNVHQYIDLNRQRMVSSAEFLIHKIQPQWKQLRSLLLHKPYHPLQLKGTLLRLDQLYQELWAQNGRLAVECAGGNRHNHEALPIWKISLMLIGTTQLIESAAEAELLSFNFYNMQQISGVIATVGIVPGYFGSIVVHLCNMYTQKLSFAQIARIARRLPDPSPSRQDSGRNATHLASEERESHGNVGGRMSETALRAATANLILNKLHRYSIHRGTSYWSSELVKRLRIVTRIEQRQFIGAVKMLQDDMLSMCSNSFRTYDIWFSFDGLLEPEDWAQQSTWMHERPALRRSMHWRCSLSHSPKIHHPLTLLCNDAYAETDEQTYDAVLGSADTSQAQAGSSRGAVSSVSCHLRLQSPELFERLANCARMLFSTTSTFIRTFGHPDETVDDAPLLARAHFRESPTTSQEDLGRSASARTARVKRSLVHDLHDLFRLGLDVPQLRDEIFVQILKEINIPVADNSSDSAYAPSGARVYDQRCLVAGLGLLTLTLSVFLPSRRFLPYMFQFLQRFRHAVLMQCAPFRRRALCLLFTVVLFGQLAKTPSIHEVKHQLQRFHHWLCDELGGGEAKDLSEAFGDAETFQLFYFDGPRENFSAEEAQNSVGVLPTLSSCMAVFEEQIADGSFEWHDSTMEGRIRDPTWWKVSPEATSIDFLRPYSNAKSPALQNRAIPPQSRRPELEKNDIFDHQREEARGSAPDADADLGVSVGSVQPLVQVSVAFNAVHENELSVTRGEILRLIRPGSAFYGRDAQSRGGVKDISMQSSSFAFVRNSRNECGFVPSRILQRTEFKSSQSHDLVQELFHVLRGQFDAKAAMARAKHAFTARNESELSFRIGDLLLIQPQLSEVSWVRGCLLTSAFDAGDSADPNASWGEVPATYLALLKPVQIVKLQGCRDSEVKFLRPTKHSDLARENHGENLETPALRAITNAGPAELEVGSDAQSNAAFGAAKAVVELAPEREIGGAQTLGVRLKVLHDFDPPAEMQAYCVRLRKGTVVFGIELVEGWWKGKDDIGRPGCFPANFVAQV